MHTKRVLGWFTKPYILFYTLPWLMIILVLGTLAQRYIGIYEAEKLFFASFIVWLGPIPTPGMYSLLTLMGVGLILKLILKSPWNAISAGNIITHLGALLLLVGAFLTAYSSEEGFIVLGEGQKGNVISDYHAREIAIYKHDNLILTLPRESLREGDTLAQLPFSASIEQTCRNCTMEEGQLTPAPLRKEDEENLFGVRISVDGKSYIVSEAGGPATITHGEDTYILVAQKQGRPLPYTVQLKQFTKFTYPGTSVAEEYESIVRIIDGEVSWQAPIRMNEPLRYKGYTLYQSSFLQVDGETYSVLAVVKNAGRVFPYIASIVMCLGLLVHIIMRRRR
jgi:hypothetical protein